MSHYPDHSSRLHLARMLSATERQIQVWFQNRRQREKRIVRFSDEASHGEPLQGLGERTLSKRKEAGDATAAQKFSPVLASDATKRMRGIPMNARALSYDSAVDHGLYGWTNRAAPMQGGGGFFGSDESAPQLNPRARSFSVDCRSSAFDDIDDLLGDDYGIDGNDEDDYGIEAEDRTPITSPVILSSFAQAEGEQLPFNALAQAPAVAPMPTTPAKAMAEPMTLHSQVAMPVSMPVSMPITMPVTMPMSVSMPVPMPGTEFVPGTAAATAMPFAPQSMTAPGTASGTAPMAAPDPVAAAPEADVHVFVHPEAPFPVLFASEAWLRLTSRTIPDVIGKPVDSLLCGPLACPTSLTTLLASAASSPQPEAHPMLVHHDAQGEPFAHSLRVEPLSSSDGTVRCLQLFFGHALKLTNQLTLMKMVTGANNPAGLNPASLLMSYSSFSQGELPLQLPTAATKTRGVSGNTTDIEQTASTSPPRGLIAAGAGAAAAMPTKTVPAGDEDGPLGNMYRTMSEMYLHEIAEMYDALSDQ